MGFLLTVHLVTDKQEDLEQAKTVRPVVRMAHQARELQQLAVRVALLSKAVEGLF
jgi:hypothetical protein